MQQTLIAQFGNYFLDQTNNIYLDGIRELHGPERDLTILKTSGTRGTIILNATNQAKVVEITGGIEVTDPISQVREFMREMMKLSQPLQIENNDGIFVYDGAYLQNPDAVFEIRNYLEKKIIRFRLVFICPKGFARSITQTTQTAISITELPYSSYIDIDGDTNPEPVITITLVDASTLTDIFFTNFRVNEQISVTGLTFADGDILVFDTANKQVLLNGTAISFNGVFPDFLPGRNYYQLTGAGDGQLVVDQQAYNDEQVLYGSKQIAESIELSGAESISQLALMIKKVSQDVFSLYEDFSGGLDGAKFNTSGDVVVVDNKLRIYQRHGGGDLTSIADTDNKTAPTPPGEPVTGFIYRIAGYSGLSDGVEFELGIDNGTHKLWFVFGGSTGKMVVRQSGGYYGGTTDLTGQFDIPSIVKLVPVGGDLQLYADDNLVLTLTGKVAQSNSRGYWKAYRSSGSSGSDTYFEVDDIKFLASGNVNADIIVEIDTDSTSDPSGTPVTNATLTIPASEIGSDFAKIIKPFTTAPSLGGTTVYHVTIYTSGGDINNYYVFKKQNTDVYADGNLETSEDDGGTWTQVTGQDLFLQVWGAYPTGFELEQAISFFPSYFNIV